MVRKSVFFSIFFFLIGAGGLHFFVQPMVRVLDARDWPQVPGVIVASDLVSHVSDSRWQTPSGNGLREVDDVDARQARGAAEPRLVLGQRWYRKSRLVSILQRRQSLFLP